MGDITGCSRGTSGRAMHTLVAWRRSMQAPARLSNRRGGITEPPACMITSILYLAFKPAAVATRAHVSVLRQRTSTAGSAALPPRCAPYVRALADPAPFSPHPLCTSDTPLSTQMGRMGGAEMMVGHEIRDPDGVGLLLNAHSLF